uniref:Uncharacterized protein n=1 Tax=Nymphaea colorata TaxID=210225 RepID=A0A5K1D0M7_9MAGN
MPLMCGQAIDVPDKTVKFTLLLSSGRPLGPRFSGQAATMFAPGARMSGFRTDGFVRLGPLEEKVATEGELELPYLVPPNRILAVGLLDDLM